MEADPIAEERGGLAMTLPPSDSWRCYRCKTVLPSPGEGHPPVTCLEELGGCGRSVDRCSDHPDYEFEWSIGDAMPGSKTLPPPPAGCKICELGTTRFFPANWGDAKCDLYVDAELRDELAPENMTLARAISILKTVMDHPDPFFHPSLILGAAQDHIIDLLHTIFYLIFGGGPDTGKGTANGCAMALCRDGIVLGTASGPHLRDTLGNGRAVAFSEFETLYKENPQILAVIRNGNRRLTAKIGLKIPAGKGWANTEVDTFGFKTMDFHDRIDAHVIGRALQFEMVRSKDLDIAMNAEYLQERLAPVRAWLAYLAARARKNGWTAEKVRATWDLEEFRARGKAFRNAWGRHGIIAAYLLLIDDIFEFGLEDGIRTLMNAREPELSPLAQEVQDAIDDLAGEDPKLDLELRVTEDVLRRVNENRASLKIPPIRSITGALHELGLNTKLPNWIPAKKNRAGPNRGKAIILPFELVRSWRSFTDETGAIGAIGAITHMEKGTLGTLGTVPQYGQTTGGQDQAQARMWAFEYARDKARVHRGVPVSIAKGDGLKEYRARFNRDPDPDQFMAGIIGGLKADEDRRREEDEDLDMPL